MATLIFNTEGGTIRQFLRFPIIYSNSDNINHSENTLSIFVYLLVWFVGTITTYGVWVPSGLFLPGILIGCAVGVIYLNFVLYILNADIHKVGGQSFVIIGSAAMLASYTRLTYSLAVIMLETSQSINIFLPVIISILVSTGIGRCFNRSLYDYAMRSK